ncbi:MAG TPA: hypothetical protein VIR57_04475 [Chloroflexota bacterium]|jgi:hypothetical protein
MALCFTFSPASMTASQYDEAIRRLDAAGAGKPAGRIHHVCCGTGDKLKVVDIWESEEAFQKFGQTLMPIMQEIGLDPGQPSVEAVHNVIRG